eukprot:9375544-Ditylum_brightwellii.AAC.1
MERIFSCGKQTWEEAAWLRFHGRGRYGCFLESNSCADGDGGCYNYGKHGGVCHVLSFVKDCTK